MTDDSDLRVAGLIVIGPDHAPDFWRRSERREEILVDASGAHGLRRPPCGETELHLLICTHILERFAPALDVVEIGVAGADDFGGNLEVWIGGEEIDELTRITIGERPDQHGVYHAEDGCAGSNTQTQREHRGDGESRASAKCTQPVAKVLHELFKPWQSRARAVGLA